MGKLDGKVAMVTGGNRGNRGIGKGIAKFLGFSMVAQGGRALNPRPLGYENNQSGFERV